MGKMNLLRANWSGTVGNTTGQVYKGRNVVKARIWSKKPNNETQTRSVRAFEALNRISSACARQFWQWLPYNDRDMLKHNKIAKEWGAVVKEHIFNISALENVIGGGGEISIDSFEVNTTNNNVSATVNCSVAGLDENLSAWWLCACNEYGQVIYSKFSQSEQEAFSITSPVEATNKYYLFCFSSSIVIENGQKSYVLGNFAMQEVSVSQDVVEFSITAVTTSGITQGITENYIFCTPSVELPENAIFRTGSAAEIYRLGIVTTALEKREAVVTNGKILLCFDSGSSLWNIKGAITSRQNVTIPSFSFTANDVEYHCNGGTFAGDQIGILSTITLSADAFRKNPGFDPVSVLLSENCAGSYSYSGGEFTFKEVVDTQTVRTSSRNLRVTRSGNKLYLSMPMLNIYYGASQPITPTQLSFYIDGVYLYRIESREYVLPNTATSFSWDFGSCVNSAFINEENEVYLNMDDDGAMVPPSSIPSYYFDNLAWGIYDSDENEVSKATLVEVQGGTKSVRLVLRTPTMALQSGGNYLYSVTNEEEFVYPITVPNSEGFVVNIVFPESFNDFADPFYDDL